MDVYSVLLGAINTSVPTSMNKACANLQSAQFQTYIVLNPLELLTFRYLCSRMNPSKKEEV